VCVCVCCLKRPDDAILDVRRDDVTERPDAGCRGNADDVIRHDVGAAGLRPAAAV